MDMTIAGTRIRGLRERRAWTQERLAEAAAISPRTVQRAEEGAMSAQTLASLAAALTIDVEELAKPAAPPEKWPRIAPSLFYRDAEAGIAFLERAFGFRTRLRVPGANGAVMHSELEYLDAVVMVATADGERKSPEQLGGAVTQGLYVFVDDVEAHYAQAKAAGARIVRELADGYGHRNYLALDLEGHHWGFGRLVG